MKDNVGIFTYHLLQKLVKDGIVNCESPIEDSQYQPASLDARLGKIAYRIRSSFVPGNRTVEDVLQELVMYPSLEDTGDYRFHSETVWTTPISDKVSFKLSFIDDYNSNPAAGKKKNDTTLATSLSYAF